MAIIVTEFPFTLPIGYRDADGHLHKEGAMRLATAADEILPLRDPRVQNNPGYLPIIVPARVITRLGTLEMINTEIIEDLYQQDYNHLLDLYNEKNGTGLGGLILALIRRWSPQWRRDARGGSSAMALTPSTMLELGTALPPFRLPSVLAAADAAPVDSADLLAQPVLVLFLSAHCPYVKHIEAELSRLAADYGDRVQLIGIASNSVRSHPQDGPEGLRAQAQSCGWSFPYLFDADQGVARAFQAACTPDPFLFDAEHRLVYRGQLDGSRPGNGLPCDGHDLRAALDAVLTGQPVHPEQRPSIGCNIKWHLPSP